MEELLGLYCCVNDTVSAIDFIGRPCCPKATPRHVAMPVDISLKSAIGVGESCRISKGYEVQLRVLLVIVKDAPSIYEKAQHRNERRQYCCCCWMGRRKSGKKASRLWYPVGTLWRRGDELILTPCRSTDYEAYLTPLDTLIRSSVFSKRCGALGPCSLRYRYLVKHHNMERHSTTCIVEDALLCSIPIYLSIA